MTENEAKSFIQGKLDCMNKCDVFDCKDTDECESCNYCYSQGNFGEQKKSFEIAIKALEKQIPKKPIIKSDRDAWFCPCCDGYIRSTYTRKEIILEEDVYCGRCGQKLDWND